MLELQSILRWQPNQGPLGIVAISTEKIEIFMKKEIKYGFTRTTLVWSFLILASVALAAIWFAFTVDSSIDLFGIEIESTTASFGILIFSGLLAVGAGITVSLMFQSRGMSPKIVMRNKSLSIPLMSKGDIEINFDEIDGWRIDHQNTRKKMLIVCKGQTYTVESRLMSDKADFEVLVKWLRRKAPKKEAVNS